MIKLKIWDDFDKLRPEIKGLIDGWVLCGASLDRKNDVAVVILRKEISPEGLTDSQIFSTLAAYRSGFEGFLKSVLGEDVKDMSRYTITKEPLDETKERDA